MNIFKHTGLLALLLFLGLAFATQAHSGKTARALYTFGFGGLENMEAAKAATLLDKLGYAGIALNGRGKKALGRLDQYYQWSERKGADFKIEAAFIIHNFDKFGFSDARHKAAIDHLAGKNAAIWVLINNPKQDNSITFEKVEQFIMGIVKYAYSKGVKVILYPHFDTYFQTTDDALKFVKKVNHPSLNTAIILHHELLSNKGDVLKKTFNNARGKIGAIILSGSPIGSDQANQTHSSNGDVMNRVSTMKTTILSLDESIYELKPFMQLIKTSGFEGPIGFLNYKLTNPEEYLVKSIKRWHELCEEVGLFEK
jgi:sugar phosphate isomerase/epimerase